MHCPILYLRMHRKKPDVDIIADILKAGREAYPDSEFIRSLSMQYEERGGLSKKQLQGLYQKVAKKQAVPEAKLATLEAVILKKPTKYKSGLPENTPLYTRDEAVGQMINSILEKFPQHKRILFFKSKYEGNETLSAVEKTELEKLHKLLMKA